MLGFKQADLDTRHGRRHRRCHLGPRSDAGPRGSACGCRRDPAVQAHLDDHQGKSVLGLCLQHRRPAAGHGRTAEPGDCRCRDGAVLSVRDQQQPSVAPVPGSILAAEPGRLTGRSSPVSRLPASTRRRPADRPQHCPSGAAPQRSRAQPARARCGRSATTGP